MEAEGAAVKDIPQGANVNLSLLERLFALSQHQIHFLG